MGWEAPGSKIIYRSDTYLSDIRTQGGSLFNKKYMDKYYGDPGPPAPPLWT